ncbi:MAG: hypothetical protein KBA61_17940 [Spirochaetes bacterium]|nr:hypothetical protein [Spirochaetota bacterium]
MRTAVKSPLKILPQPDEITCGPTCLHAVYGYYGDDVPLFRVIDEVRGLDEGGTLAVFLGNHALRRGYAATIYTFNLQIFDPTWFRDGVDLRAKLSAQAKVKPGKKLRVATQGYREFLERGGKIRYQDLTISLLKKFLYQDIPVLTGLSATYLYDSAREIGATNEYDDLRGEPSGHFVVMSRYDTKRRQVLIADPYRKNPISRDHYYQVGINRLIHSILLGIVTYDSNLLIIQPK